MKRRWIIIIIILVALVVACRYALLGYFSQEFKEGCAPCPDIAKCRPLELSLELSPPWPRVHQRYTLWFRARMKNVSCLKLAEVDLWSFGNVGRDGRRLDREELYLKIWNSQGRELRSSRYSGDQEKYWIEQEKKARESGNVEDQETYRRKLEQWKESGLDKGIDGGPSFPEEGKSIIYTHSNGPAEEDSNLHANEHRLDFLPGNYATTASSYLHPQRAPPYKPIDVWHPDGRVETFVRPTWERMPIPPGTPEAPKGFQVLANYHFLSPGKYRAAIFFTQNKIRACRIYPNYEHLPRFVYRILNWLAIFDFWDLRQESCREISVDAQSNTVEFEVSP